MVLQRDFYLKNANVVAAALLGKLLVHDMPEGISAGMIVEVEAYVGPNDKGSHAYLNYRSARTDIQFGDGGYAYIYTIYGMHSCFNVVCNEKDKPEVVLVRALEPIKGIELMQSRREKVDKIELCNGPGKLCKALDISKRQYGYDLCNSKLFIEDYREITCDQIMVSPRVNIDYAEECKDYLWRYYIKDNKYISKVAKCYSSKVTLRDFLERGDK